MTFPDNILINYIHLLKRIIIFQTQSQLEIQLQQNTRSNSRNHMVLRLNMQSKRMNHMVLRLNMQS